MTNSYGFYPEIAENMQLTYIANARFPTEKAHGLQIAKTVDALQQSGVKVKLVLPWRMVLRKFKLPPPEKFYNLRKPIRSARLPSLDFLFLAQGSNGLGNLLYLLQSISFMLSVILYSLWRRSETIYSRDSLLLFPLCFWHRRLFVELHTFPTTKLGTWTARNVLSHAKGVVVTNTYLQKKVEKVGVDPSRILIAPNGADLGLVSSLMPRNKAKKKLMIPERKRVVLYLGNFYRSKGVYVLVEASKDLPEDVLVLIVGGSRIDRNIEPLKAFARNKKASKVEIHPHQPRERVPLYLSAADVCVLPNIVTDEESEFFTTPMKMLDYMVAKRPIVASDLPAIRQILSTETAWLVEPANSVALAAGISKALLENSRSSMKAKKALLLAKKLSWDNRAKAITDFIHEKL